MSDVQREEPFGQRVIAYRPLFAIMFGSINAALVLSQLLYWDDKGWKPGWTYKTVRDMYWELGMTRSQQETAIKKLKSEGVIEVVRKSVPATRHFKVNVARLNELIASWQDFSELEFLKPADKIAESEPTITQTTTQSTAKNTNKNKKEKRFPTENEENDFSWINEIDF